MNANINQETAQERPLNGMSGISLTEVIIALVVMMILTAISIPYMYNYKRMYKSEDQALKVMDLMREANQMALTRRRTMRFEVDLTDNKILIIDEDTTVTPAVHREIKSIPLEAVTDVRMDQIPTGVSKPNPPNYNDAAFATDATGHKRGSTTVTGHNVWAIRFKSDGSAVNSANVPVSATLYFWSPLTTSNTNTNSNTNTTPRRKEEVRAITIFGGSSAIRYWRHNGTTFSAY